MKLVLSRRSKMYNNNEKRYLRKSRSDKMIAGVCGGLANYLGVDSTMVRLLGLYVQSSLEQAYYYIY